MKYSIDYSTTTHPELLLVGSQGNTNTWRVYFDEEKKVDTYRDGDNTFNVETFKAKYIETTKSKSEEVTALQLIKEAKIADLESFDSSDNINCFYLNGMPVWLDKDTRVGVMNSTRIQKDLGYQNTTFWIGTFKIEVPCDLAIQLLSSIEVYAMNCFNKTAEHKKTIGELTSISEVVKYDFEKGYPDKLNITI
jgi:hypothetical protein